MAKLAGRAARALKRRIQQHVSNNPSCARPLAPRPEAVSPQGNSRRLLAVPPRLAAKPLTVPADERPKGACPPA